MSPNLLYFLDCCRHKIKPTAIIDENTERIVAKNRGYLDLDGKLTPTALIVLDEFETLLVKSKKVLTSTLLGDEGLKNIEIYREIFPAIRVPKVGLLRQTTQELQEKFIWFFKRYPQFNWEDVLNAADYYIHIKNRENMEFITTSSYFIQRTDNFSKTSRSLLADYCQMIADNPEIVNG